MTRTVRPASLTVVRRAGADQRPSAFARSPALSRSAVFATALFQPPDRETDFADRGAISGPTFLRCPPPGVGRDRAAQSRPRLPGELSSRLNARAFCGLPSPVLPGGMRGFCRSGIGTDARLGAL
jgi:hypothetical protein